MKTLDEVRALIAYEAARLDPDSRYVRELTAVVDASLSVQDLAARLNAGCRGKHWAGDIVFGKMTLADAIRSNLITSEPSLMRFEAPELEFLRESVLPRLAQRQGEAQLLSFPCSHGEEAVNIAGECLDAGMKTFIVHGMDLQRACIDSARSGMLPYRDIPRHVRCLVDVSVMDYLRFRTADVFKDPIGGPYDLIVCRNFLGYFTPGVAHKVLQTLCASLRTNNAFLFVDDFILGKHPEIFDRLPLRRIDGAPVFCSFSSGMP